MLLLITAAGPGFAAELTNLWEFNLGTKSDTGPAIAEDGTIYVTTWEGQLFALNREGTQKWVFHTRPRIEIRTSPAVAADGTIYFGSRDRRFYAVSPAGRKKWEFKTGGWVDSSAAIGKDGTVYFGSWDMAFYALSPEGKQKWIFKSGAEIVSSPAIGGDGTVYFGSHDGRFYALGPGGAKRWEFATRGPIISSPAIGKEGELYFTSVDGFLYALNPDGKLRWKLKTGGITGSSPVLSPDGALFLGVNKEVWCVSAEGKQIWPRGTEDLIVATPVAHEDLSVSCIVGWGILLDLDRQRTPLWSYWLAAVIDGSPALGREGTIYAPGKGTWFYALGPVSPMAKTTWPKFRGNSRNTGNVADSPAFAAKR